jgi:hypothetical protein
MSNAAEMINDLISRRNRMTPHGDPAASSPDQAAFVSDADMAKDIQLAILNSGAHPDSIGAAAGPATSAHPDSDAFAQAVEKLSQAADKLARSNPVTILS